MSVEFTIHDEYVGELKIEVKTNINSIKLRGLTKRTKCIWGVEVKSIGEKSYEIIVNPTDEKEVVCEVFSIMGFIKDKTLDLGVVLLSKLKENTIVKVLKLIEDLAKSKLNVDKIRLTIIAGSIPDNILNNLGFKKELICYVKILQ